jgi:hypothetical protein
MSFMTALKQQSFALTSQKGLELQLQLSPFAKVVLKRKLFKSVPLSLVSSLTLAQCCLATKTIRTSLRLFYSFANSTP